MLRYVTLVSDTFKRANENPVNPAVWSDYPPTSIPANQIVSDELEPAAIPGPSGDSISIYSGITWPVNQWAQVQIDACNSPDFPSAYSTVLLIMGRGASQTNGYGFEVDGPLGPSCNLSIFSINNDAVTNYLSDGGNDVQLPLHSGDLIRMELFNGTISAYTIHNGVSTQILAPVTAAPVTFGPAPLNNGPVALDLFINSVPSDVQLSNFSGGLIETSEPTDGTIVGPYKGMSLALAFTNPLKLDILQVVSGGQKCIWKLTSNGTAVLNPTSHTSEALLARYEGDTVGAAFSNTDNLDLLQIVSPGGSVVFYVDYQGTAHS